MNLSESFDQELFLDWADEFLPDFRRDIRKVDIPHSYSGVESILTLGESSLGVRIYAINIDSDPAKRKVGLANESFSLLKNYGTPNAIIAYYSPNYPQWRLSLLTSTPTWDDGKIITKLSNPKRQSYVLGQKAKVKTPQKFIIAKGRVVDFTDLKSRFSVEVVNKEFYQEISGAFTKLVGGTTSRGKTKTNHVALLHLPSVVDSSQTSLEFAVRLIGRIIFCWFLREKRSESGIALMPRELLSDKATDEHQDYYHKILEPIFFEILNKPIKSRRDEFAIDPFSTIPYLNGGLFSPQEDDYYKLLNGDLQSRFHNTLIIPDKWFKELFEVLETYNFTIDENTSFDEELSIDPEMLGRIFENLLAEINPETGESARKSTGSYYTPRVIVDYMVDESLCLYLKEKTNIDEEKLRPLISYDLEDDLLNQLSDDDRSKIAEALSAVKILDPACGSGAFPIGALQKIVFMLQQIDPHGQLWFKKQIHNTPIELKRVIEREFQQKNFDYLRKLGIIRENIYGVDIQPIATEISRLRCFLTLVVDERIDESLENRGIEPLPNLDFKFVTANTLIGLPSTGKSVNQMGLFEDDEGIKELREVREMFFNASGTERDSLKLQFVQTQNRMFQKLIADNLRGHADLTAKLTTWDPFSHKSASWFDPEWMFGIKSGFDLIIGNPPYIQFQKLSISMREVLRKHTYYESQSDIWYFFVYRAMDFLLENGILNLIVSNYFLDSAHAKTLRSFISKNFKIGCILDFRGSKIFDNASINTLVFHLIKTTERANTVAYLQLNSETYGGYLNIYKNLIDARNFLTDKWIIANDEDSQLLDKILENSTRLGDISQIGTGIKSGDDKVFVLDSSQVESLNIEKTVLRKWIKNSQIGRYSYQYSNLFVIYTHKDLDIEKYPNTERYLSEYREELESKWKSRGEQTDYWRLYRAREYLFQDVYSDLILCPYKAPSNRFCIGNNVTGSGDIYAIKLHNRNDILFILGILNSKLGNWINIKTGKKKGNLYEYYTEPLSIIPIKNTNQEFKISISDLVRKVINIKQVPDNFGNRESSDHCIRIEDQINQMVYELYGLSPKEIKIIEEGTNG